MTEKEKKNRLIELWLKLPAAERQDGTDVLIFYLGISKTDRYLLPNKYNLYQEVQSILRKYR